MMRMGHSSDQKLGLDAIFCFSCLFFENAIGVNFSIFFYFFKANFRSQSYDLGIYNYIASVVVCRLERFSE
jgi:hypothetical protein